MRLSELIFIAAVTLWLFMPLVYFLLIRFSLDVKLTARNKASRGGNARQDRSQLRASSD